MGDEGKSAFQRKAERLGKDLQSCGCALLVLGAVLMVVMSVVAGAADRPYASQCLADADIDAAIGARVRAGAFFIDTSGVPDRPLCSGLTLAQQIQRIRAAAFPEEQARAEAARAKITPEPVAPPPIGVASEPQYVLGTIDPPKLRPRRKAAAGQRSAGKKAKTGRAESQSSFYASCRAARAAGAAPIRRGQAGYSRNLDRDGDGIACE